MSYNNLSDPDVIEVLARMQSLHVLNMIGNPLLRKTIDYRRNLLYKCSDITYLDSRPVTEKDRICLQAWAKVDRNNLFIRSIYVTFSIGWYGGREEREGKISKRRA